MFLSSHSRARLLPPHAPGHRPASQATPVTRTFLALSCGIIFLISSPMKKYTFFFFKSKSKGRWNLVSIITNFAPGFVVSPQSKMHAIL